MLGMTASRDEKHPMRTSHLEFRTFAESLVRLLTQSRAMGGDFSSASLVVQINIKPMMITKQESGTDSGLRVEGRVMPY